MKKPYFCRTGTFFALAGLAAGLTCFQPAAEAVSELFDDFETYPLGNVADDEASPWVPHNTGLFTIVEEANNRFLAYGWSDGDRGGSRPLPESMEIDPGGQATVFLQFRGGALSQDSSESANFGLSHDIDTSAHGPEEDFRVHTRIIPGPSESEHYFQVRDGGEWQTLTTVSRGVWHNLWYVIDRGDGDTFQLYLNSDAADAASGDRLSYDADGAEVIDFSFRDEGSSAEVLDGFAAYAHAASSRNMHLDNIWIDNTGENLTFLGADLNAWQFAFEPLEAPFSLDFGTGSGQENGESLLRSRPDDFRIQSNALRLLATSEDFVSSAALASVPDYETRSDFVLEAEMRLNKFGDTGSSRAGLAVLGGPHTPIESPFDAANDQGFYGLVWSPAIDSQTSLMQIRQGFNGSVLAEAVWEGDHPSAENNARVGQVIQFEAAGEYDASGLLHLTFEMTDQDGFSQSISTSIFEPFEGNLFGIGGYLSEDGFVDPEFDYRSLSMTTGDTPVEIDDPITLWPFSFSFGSADGRDSDDNFRQNRADDWSLEEEALRLATADPDYHPSLSTTWAFNYESGEAFELRMDASLEELAADPEDNRFGLVFLGDSDREVFDPEDEATYYTLQLVSGSASGTSLVMRQGMDGAILAETPFAEVPNSPAEPAAGAEYSFVFTGLYTTEGNLVFIATVTDSNGGEVELLAEVEDPRAGGRFGFGAWHRSNENAVWDVGNFSVQQPTAAGAETPFTDNDHVLGWAHDEDRLGYFPGGGDGDVGSRGPSGNMRHKNPLLGFELPDVPRENIVRFEITVSRAGGRNDIPVDLYGLVPADPSTYTDGSVTGDPDGIDVWYRGTDPDDREDLVGAVWQGFMPSSAPAGESYRQDVTDFVRSFYDPEEGRTQEKVFFRLSPQADTTLNNLQRTEVVHARDQSDSPRLTYTVFPPEEPDPFILWPFGFAFGSAEGRDGIEDFIPGEPGEWSFEQEALRLAPNQSDYTNSLLTTRVSDFGREGDFSIETEFTLESLGDGAAENRVALVLFGENDVDVFDPDDAATYYTAQWIPRGPEGGSLVVRAGMDGSELARTDFSEIEDAPEAAAGMTYRLGFHALYDESSGGVEFIAGLSDEAGRFARAAGEVAELPGSSRSRFGIGARHSDVENPVWVFDRYEGLARFLWARGGTVTAPFDWEFGTAEGQLGYHAPLPFPVQLRAQDWSLQENGLRHASTAPSNDTGRLGAIVENYRRGQDFQMTGEIFMVDAGGGPWDQMNFTVLGQPDDPDDNRGYALSFEPHQSDGRMRIRAGYTGSNVLTQDWTGLYAGDGAGTTFGYDISGEFEDGVLTLSFTLTDQNGHTQTLTRDYEDPDHGNVFGLAVRGDHVGNPAYDYTNFSLELGEVPEVQGFADWQADHFDDEQMADPEISGPAATPAGDGVANLLKYAFGFEPFTPVSGADLPRADVVSGVLTMTYPELQDAPDILYFPEASENLADWSGDPVTEVNRIDHPDKAGFDEVTVEADLDGAARGFLRVRVIQD